MGDVVNLNQFRKKQAKRSEDKQAAENRVTFGRSKGQRDTAKQNTLQAEHELDGKRLD